MKNHVCPRKEPTINKKSEGRKKGQRDKKEGSLFHREATVPSRPDLQCNMLTLTLSVDENVFLSFFLIASSHCLFISVAFSLR